jgi:hypothetical protein
VPSGVPYKSVTSSQSPARSDDVLPLRRRRHGAVRGRLLAPVDAVRRPARRAGFGPPLKRRSAPCAGLPSAPTSPGAPAASAAVPGWVASSVVVCDVRLRSVLRCFCSGRSRSPSRPASADARDLADCPLPWPAASPVGVSGRGARCGSRLTRWVAGSRWIPVVGATVSHRVAGIHQVTAGIAPWSSTLLDPGQGRRRTASPASDGGGVGVTRAPDSRLGSGEPAKIRNRYRWKRPLTRPGWRHHRSKEPAMTHPIFLFAEVQHRQEGLLGLRGRSRRDTGDDRPWWRRSRPSQPSHRLPAGRLVACGPAVAE